MPTNRAGQQRERADVHGYSTEVSWSLDVVVVGGCGRVGLPLALVLADTGLKVVAYDRNLVAVDTVSSAKMPFLEPEAVPMLERVVGSGRLTATADANVIGEAEFVVVVIGTPVDEHLNPDAQAVPAAIDEFREQWRAGQTIVLRSTVYPGVSRLVNERIEALGKDIAVTFCPERIAEGKALTELYTLPQIVSGFDDEAVAKVSALFGRLTDQIVRVTPEEAELTKLFTNAWRYIKFAAANQFFMIANEFGLDFETIRNAIRHEYPRAADLPGAGLTAGPCLFKDTMQLAAFNNNNFVLGHASMMVNEGLPLYMASRMEKRFDLKSMTVGILGMAFKGESDDIRSSLAYKLRRILKFKAKDVICTDPYVTVDPSLVPMEEVLANADLLVVAAPHDAYRELDFQQPVIDIWNLFKRGVLT
jgi:UDP-N-acetyl-D-mannosaminuronic acid dehydrogenase